MPDWNALRLRARQQHERLAQTLPGEQRGLPCADALLDAAQAETGVACIGLNADDGLLAGAHAVLDRDTPVIWYDASADVSRPRQRFAQAHEYAHWWLHPDTDEGEADNERLHRFVSQDEPEQFMAPVASVVETAAGYSRSERREIEANLFAAELLLPAPALRRVVQERKWTVEQIARHTGLSETCVLSQMVAALLPAPAPPETVVSAPHAKEEKGVSPSVTFALDASQQRAAHAEHGPMLVDAGPGTGKTRTLIARIVHLLQDRHVPPDAILALTFSNKAAEEMRVRLRAAVGHAAERVWIGTFHAFGLELLRKDGQAIGLPPSPALLEAADANTLLLANLHRLPLEEYLYPHQPHLPFDDILRCISRAKDELITPADYLAAAEPMQQNARDEAAALTARKAVEVARCYGIYQELLASAGQVDFGDLLMRPVELLDACAEVCTRWQAQFTHILADEYQDVNRASAELLRRLAGEGAGFWAVGDLRQAIYRFRGASPANVTRFARDFPGGKRNSLERNYRSREPIVRLVGAFAGVMREGGEAFRTWETERGQADFPAVTLALADSPDAQAKGLADTLREWQTKGVPLSEQAILCRTNRQAAELSARLQAEGIATRSRANLLDSEAVKDMLALLSLCSEPDGAALQRVARFADYALLDADVKRIWEQAKAERMPILRALFAARRDEELSNAGRSGLTRLCRDIGSLRHVKNVWLFLARYLFVTSRYLSPLLQDESLAAQQERLALDSLLLVAQKYAPRFAKEANPHAAFLEHLRSLALYGLAKSLRVESEGAAFDAVRVETVHQAKGLEFAVVYLPTLGHGQFPPRKQGSMAALPPALLMPESDSEEVEDAEILEEERLFFVALSRAREHLVLSRIEQGKGKDATPSPLLKTLEPLLAGGETLRVRWQEDANEPEGPAVHEELAAKPTVSASALEQYMICPRQYYYQRIARLPRTGEESAFLAFHRCLDTTTQWLREQRTEGEAVSPSDVQAYFDAQWRQAGDVLDGPHGLVLRQHAAGLLETLYDEPLQAVAAPSPSRELTARLEHGAVRVQCDTTETLADGTLRLVKSTTGRRKDEDQRDPRLAVMRVAAHQEHPEQAIEIALHYQRSGECRPIAENRRYEPDRVAKYDAALKGIRQGHFAPDAKSEKCGECPYLLICPS